jgi:peptidoglycan/xylan/chitin deacetylase (PgdA/CDA1 family)
MARHFEPVSLSAIVDAIQGRIDLPHNALTVTVDDGYRDFLLHGHPIFRRHGIPITIYAVSGFADRRLWLWPDQIEFAIQHTEHRSLEARVHDGPPLQLKLATKAERSDSAALVMEALKESTDSQRLAFLPVFARLCHVEFPSEPPAARSALNWEELRALAAEGVEIGCHTETHPILSKLSNAADLQREIRGAKEQMEQKLKFPVRHFCYPNGKPADIGKEAIRSVQEAGYASGVTCTWGLNKVGQSPFEIRRVPLDSGIDLSYGKELLASLHM